MGARKTWLTSRTRRSKPISRLSQQGCAVLRSVALHLSLTHQTQVARDPEQVLRYGFDGELAPLWPSRAPVPAAEDVPPCSRCGALR